MRGNPDYTKHTLIIDADLRRRLGSAARREAEQGKFSLEGRNERLKRVLVKVAGADARIARQAR